jgi:hypothetical protein
MNSKNLGRRSTVLVLFALTLATTTFAQKRGYKYDTGGNITGIVDVAADVNNCGTVGKTCLPGQSCYDEVCCAQPTCNGACCANSAATCCNGSCCAAPGVCFGTGPTAYCCAPKTNCNQWAACGTIDDGCGHPLNCGPACGTGELCTGNLCYVVGTSSHIEENNATGELSIVAGKYDVEVLSQFVSSKGLFGGAMKLSPNPQNPAAALCKIDNGLPNCLLYTFYECIFCPVDPNAQGGEISCWCINPIPLKYDNILAGKSLSFSSQLYIDKLPLNPPPAPPAVNFTPYGQSDEIRDSSSRIGPPPAHEGGNKRGAVRYYNIINNVVRYEWEDFEKAPAGDYNDYVGQVSFKDCDGTPYPPEILDWDPEIGLTCPDICEDLTTPRSCPNATVSKPPELRITSKVMVDSILSDQYREKRGKLLTLSVLLQSRIAQDVAVCPVLHFNYGSAKKWDCPAGQYSPDFIQQQEYTDSPGTICSPGTVTPGPNGFEPVCTTDFDKACDTFPVALAREQWYKPNRCQTSGSLVRKGIGDIVHLTGSSAPPCSSADSQLVDFQLALEDVDKTMSSTPNLAGRGGEGILNDPANSLDTVDLYVFDNLPTKTPFHCPTGVNVDFKSWADQTGKGIRVRKYIMYNEKNYAKDSRLYFGKEYR